VGGRCSLKFRFFASGKKKGGKIIKIAECSCTLFFKKNRILDTNRKQIKGSFRQYECNY